MARSASKSTTKKSALTNPTTEQEVDEFLTELDEARRYRDDLAKERRDLPPTEIIARRENLPEARRRAAELEKQCSDLRGDNVSSSQTTAADPIPSPATPDGRMKIQAEAYEHWIRLKASGANPSVHSICPDMAKWCANNHITTRTGTTPMAGTIRNTILGGSSGWEPPTHSRDQAIEHVARLEQVAQPLHLD